MQEEETFVRNRDFSGRPQSLAGPRDLGPLGAIPFPDGVVFRVWAPRARSMALCLEEEGGQRTLSMEREEGGYFRLFLQKGRSGLRYRYLIDDTILRPDPASRFQPDGVHGPSMVIETPEALPTTFSGHLLRDLIFYEIHVGTFSPSGTFDGILPFLDHLCSLGVTALELMPVSQFPGTRNWGYDGVYPYAIHSSYGGPEGLLRLVREAHRRGLSLFLDIVYNHLGPEGNYLSSFGPYFSRTTTTPWGEALNFDGPDSDHVRHFFLEHLRYLANQFDVDGVRFDAIHAIRDLSPCPFLADLAQIAQNISERRNRPFHLVAESNANDRRTVLPVDSEGLGLDAQWSDDFHHALHVVLTGENRGYYEDFQGMDDLLEAIGHGFVYRGQPSASFRCRRGSLSDDLPGASFVFFAQNHDQTGNRMHGERLSALVPPEALFAVSALVLLSPGLPLLFMGEEYGETRPFLYFTDHNDPDLIVAVRKGRTDEFSAFSWEGEVPDPQDPETFARSRLTLTEETSTLSDTQRRLLAWTSRLAGLRRSLPTFFPPPQIAGPESRVLCPAGGVLAHLRTAPGHPRTLLLVNLSRENRLLAPFFFRNDLGFQDPLPLLDSRDPASPEPLFHDALLSSGLLLEPFRTLLFVEGTS